MAKPMGKRTFSSNEGAAIPAPSIVVVRLVVCLFIASLGITFSRVALAEEILLDVPLFNQKDSAWSSKLGDCPTATIASHGCAVTSLAMVYAFYQPGCTNPKRLNEDLKREGAFVNRCEISWTNLMGVAKGANPSTVKVEGYVDVNSSLYQNDVNYRIITNSKIDVQLKAKDPVIAGVSYVANGFLHKHFVVIVGKDTTGTYILNEPSGGYRRKLSSTSYQLTRLVFFERLPTSATTATVLVMDVSGSMAWQWKGGAKIESAQQAALQFIEQVANEPRLPGASHMIGVVTFSGTASLVLPLTQDYARAKQAIINLGTISATNLGDGLITGLQELDRVLTAQRFVILLSDGMTNTGMSRGQILTGPVVSARSKRVCIHTVAFGDPGDIDEDFLRKIASGSGCGSYNYAASGFQLFGTYVKIRHAMLGSNRIVEFTSETSKGSRVYVLPGQSIALGAFQLTGPAQEIHYTLAWSEPGRMRAKLVDPSGRQVNYTYPGVKIYSGNGFSHVTVFSPKQGIWRVAVVVGTTFPRGIEYYGVTSARTGGIVIPYRVPKICIFDDICIPLPDLPTTLIVIISVGALAVFLYQQLVVK